MAHGPVARYERMCSAVGALTELSDGPAEIRLAAVLTGDEVVLARMRAAAAVLRAAVLPDGPAALEDPAAAAEEDLLDAAIGWQRYARETTDALHRACATDMARGALRLWAARRRPPAADPLARRLRLRRARLTLLNRVRTRCAALRTELRDDVAALTGRGTRDFGDYAARRIAQVAAELADEVDWELPDGADADLPFPAVATAPDRTPGELRLTGLLGAAFGLGAALTLSRLLDVVGVDWPVIPAVLSAGVGILLAGWVVAARRLLARRAALDRWVTEAAAALRAGLEERIALRALAAEAADARSARAGPADARSARAGDRFDG